MDRREFVKTLALWAAGAAAMPEQVKAFEQYYDVNSPDDWPLLCIYAAAYSAVQGGEL